MKQILSTLLLVVLCAGCTTPKQPLTLSLVNIAPSSNGLYDHTFVLTNTKSNRHYYIEAAVGSLNFSTNGIVKHSPMFRGTNEYVWNFPRYDAAFFRLAETK